MKMWKKAASNRACISSDSINRRLAETAAELTRVRQTRIHLRSEVYGPTTGDAAIYGYGSTKRYPACD